MEEPKTRKGGRPPKADREKKAFRIDLKLTEEDYNRLEKQYQHSGYRNKSEMYHDMLFNQTLRQKDSASLEVLQVLQQLAREIKAIGADYRKAAGQVPVQSGDGMVAELLQNLIRMTSVLQEKEQEMFQIIIKLREKWLPE